MGGLGPLTPTSHLPDASVLLRTEHAVAGVLARSATREAAIAELLPAIGDALGWATGGLWTPVAGPGTALYCETVWSAAGFDGAEWEQACRATTLAPGEQIEVDR